MTSVWKRTVHSLYYACLLLTFINLCVRTSFYHLVLRMGCNYCLSHYFAMLPAHRETPWLSSSMMVEMSLEGREFKYGLRHWTTGKYLSTSQ